MQLLPLLIAFLIGAAAGGLYFAGLWITVRKLPGSDRPTLVLLASFALRLALLLLLVWLLLNSRQAHWSHILSGAAGLLLARTVLIRRLGTG
jgi:F1F0 ATPase subunit 2